MSTIKVKGQEVRVGDDLWAGGVPHRIPRGAVGVCLF